MSQPLTFLGQLARLGLTRRDPLDLLELEPQQVELALAAGRHLAQPGRPLLQRAHASIRLGHALKQLRLSESAMAVQDVELHRREHQPAVLVLAVEGKQRAAELAQVGHGGRASAHVGAGAPVGPDPPRQHDLLGAGGQQLELGQLRR